MHSLCGRTHRLETKLLMIWSTSILLVLQEILSTEQIWLCTFWRCRRPPQRPLKQSHNNLTVTVTERGPDIICFSRAQSTVSIQQSWRVGSWQVRPSLNLSVTLSVWHRICDTVHALDSVLECLHESAAEDCLHGALFFFLPVAPP